VLRRLGGVFFGRVFPGNVGGSFVFRFSFGPNATCAFREGVGPRAVGFSSCRMIEWFSLETVRRTRSALFRLGRLAETRGWA